MQARQERKAIHNAIGVMSALAIVGWLGAGCGQAGQPEPAAVEASDSVQAAELAPVAPTEAPPPVEAEQWEPETVQPANDTHAGHDHGPGGHSH